MGNKLTLRSLFVITTLAAVMLMLVRLAVASSGENAMIALLVMLLIPIVTFALFGIVFLLLLPVGVIASLSTESAARAESPFAQDRLPEKLIESSDPTRAN